MKFSRTLEKGQTNEWKSEYIDYVGLKRLIKTDKRRFIEQINYNVHKVNKFFKEQQDKMVNIKDNIFNLSKGEESDENNCKNELLNIKNSDKNILISKPSDNNIKKELNQEYVNVEVYKDSDKINQINDYQNIPNDNQEIQSNKNSGGVFKNESVVIIENSVNKNEKDKFQNVEELEIDKIEYIEYGFTKETEEPENKKSNGYKCSFIEYLTNKYFSLFSHKFKIDQFKKSGLRYRRKALQKYISDCNRVNKFASLNLTGFKKIIKKYDKNHNTSLVEEMMPEIENKYFVKSKIIEEIIKEAKELYKRLFANNNKRAAKKDFKKILDPEKQNQFASFFGGAFFAVSLFMIHLIEIEKEDSVYNFFLSFNLFFYGFYLFGLCMIIFKKYFINYEFIFDYDVVSDGTIHSYIFLVSLFTLIHNGAFYMKFIKGHDVIGPVIPFLINMVCLISPFDFLYLSSRYFFIGALAKILFPTFSIEFKHFYITDCLLSFSYCYCLILTYMNEKIDRKYILLVSIIFPIYRIVQALRRQFDTKQGISHYLNAGKYITSILFIISCFVYNGNRNLQNHITKIVLGISSTVYSLYWDISMDWGLPRRRMIYSRNYYIVIISYNVIARLLWIVDHMYETYKEYICMAEITRRFMWTLLRVEYEHLNNCNRLKALSSIKLAELFYKKDENYGDDCGSSVFTATGDATMVTLELEK